MESDFSENGVSVPNTTDDHNLKDFIQQLEKLPVLWDSKHEYYSNKSERNKSYASLLTTYKKIKPKATLDDVRKKINTLKSNYRKILKRVDDSKKENPFGEPYKPKSWVFHMLHFLKEADSKLNEDEREINAAGSGNYYPMVEVVIEEGHPEDEAEDTRARSSSFSSTEEEALIPVKKIKQEDLAYAIAKQTALLQDTCSLTPQPEKKQSALHPNINPTALYWSEKLERLDTMQRIFAEKAINDVLFEAQLGNLKKNSVIINESTPAITPLSNNVFASSATNSVLSKIRVSKS